jgi:hypothetical protein
MLTQGRFKQSISLKERLASFARKAREEASMLQPGQEKYELLRKAGLADTASRIDDWANSPGLQSPK